MEYQMRTRPQIFKTGLTLNNFKIKTKLLITYSTLIVLLIVTISTFFYFNSVRIIRDKSIHYTLGILEQIRNNVDINLEQIDRASYPVISSKSILNILQYGKSSLIAALLVEPADSVEKTLYDVMFSRRDIESVNLFDLKGNRWSTNYYRSSIDYSRLAQEAKRGQGRFVWIDLKDEKGTIAAARLVNNGSLEPVGILQLNIRKSMIQNIFSQQMAKMNGQLYVINRQGIVISSLGDCGVAGGIRAKIFKRIGSKEGFFIDTINKMRNIIIFYPSQFNDWRYVGIIPLREITREANDIGKISLIAALISLLCFIPLSYMAVTGIIEPLHHMTALMREAKIKDWAPRINYRGNDEIAYLSEAFNDMVLRINTLIDEVYEQKLRRNQQELRALQAQINPHFLYNTLETISWMARAKNVPEVAGIIKALSDMMRYSISHNEEIVSIEKELFHVQNYCTIQQARYGEKFKVRYEIDADIRDCDIPKLTIQPLVENAIIHGLKGISANGLIEISGSVSDKKICLRVSDNGLGMNAATVAVILQGKPSVGDDRHSGIGVSNVQQRLRLTYGEEYGLKVFSKINEGTTFEIWLPYCG
jgi:two-component system sensor histidine kinase YesM